MRVCLRRSVPGLLAIMLAVVSCSVASGTGKRSGERHVEAQSREVEIQSWTRTQRIDADDRGSRSGTKVEVTGIAGDGTPMKWGYSGNFDGKEIRVTGNNPDADIVMMKRRSPTTTRTNGRKMANKRW